MSGQEHPCQRPAVQITNPDGAVVANFLQLCGEYSGYYGGLTDPGNPDNPLRGIMWGPHFNTSDLLPIVGQIALKYPDPAAGGGYQIRSAGSGLYYCAQIGRVMDVRQLAGAAGCSEDHVREYFASVVTIAEAGADG